MGVQIAFDEDMVEAGLAHSAIFFSTYSTAIPSGIFEICSFAASSAFFVHLLGDHHNKAQTRPRSD
jgi:hypothetical protein